MSEINWTTPEQDFMHQYFMMQAKKLDKEELLEIFEQVHKQYLFKTRFLNCMIKWCAKSGVALPDIKLVLSV
jgi:hypothetical protein